MNDKFKMLALQAQMGTADFDAGSYYVATPDKMQLFAELIVKNVLNKQALVTGTVIINGIER
jgi:hypothetical protein